MEQGSALRPPGAGVSESTALALRYRRRQREMMPTQIFQMTVDEGLESMDTTLFHGLFANVQLSKGNAHPDSELLARIPGPVLQRLHSLAESRMRESHTSNSVSGEWGNSEAPVDERAGHI